MGWLSRKPTPQELHRAYRDGWVTCTPDPVTRDAMLESGEVRGFGDSFTEPVKDLHKQRPRQLLFKPLRKLDPKVGGKNQGALASESQTTGDCVSHSGRNCVDLTRAYEIVVKGEPDRWIVRGSTEYGYSGRGHRGPGMSPERHTRIMAEGQLLRLDYRDEGGPDLRKYNSRTGSQHSSIPEAWKEIAKDELRTDVWLHAKTVEDALDAMAAGYGGRAGSQFASRASTGADGLNTKSGSWNHDMAHAGYDLTREIWKTEVVFVPNSWGAWNKPNPVWERNTDTLGPWIPGMLVVPLETFERHIIRAGSAYYHGRVEGDAIKPLPMVASDFANWTEAA